MGPDLTTKTMVGGCNLLAILCYVTPVSRDSGNDFWVPEIGSENSHFLFILFLYPHVVPNRFSKRLLFLGADFRFWS